METKTATTFTPGPWEWLHSNALFSGVTLVLPVVFDAFDLPTPADASLIAAAPLLFEAAEALTSVLRGLVTCPLCRTSSMHPHGRHTDMCPGRFAEVALAAARGDA